jgi:hypothetical protein
MTPYFLDNIYPKISYYLASYTILSDSYAASELVLENLTTVQEEGVLKFAVKDPHPSLRMFNLLPYSVGNLAGTLSMFMEISQNKFWIAPSDMWDRRRLNQHVENSTDTLMTF